MRPFSLFVRALFGSFRFREASLLLVLALGAGIVPTAAPASTNARGMPLARTYAFHDIGHVPRGSRLSFDGYGRVAVVNEGVYSVLNDTSWLSFVSPETNPVLMTVVGLARDRRSYYGAAGSWGRVELGADGRLHPLPLVPENAPAWTKAAVFDDLIFLSTGVVFASRDGLVYLDFRDERCQIYDIPKVSRVFALGEAVYVSSFDQPLQRVDFDRRQLVSAAGTLLDEIVVERAIDLNGRSALLSLLDNRLVLFDGKGTRDWAGQKQPELVGRISSLQRLADGNVAVAVTGGGVFILSPAGERLWSLTSSPFHRVSNIASNEPGVLWMVTEHAVEMVWYGSGLTSFDQSLGLPVAWPLIARWKDRLFVASDGVLYEGITPGPGRPTHFQRHPAQPPGGAWSLTANDSHLLTGNVDGIYSMNDTEEFTQIGQVTGLAYLVAVEGDACFAIGHDEVALLEWNGERWEENLPRAPGIPGASVAHRIGDAAWVEMGPRGVARLSKSEGNISVMTLRNEDWTDERWVNVGVVGDTVVLSAKRNQRRFFDEATETWVGDPELVTLLDRSPYYLTRVRSDDTGMIWAAHFEGVLRFSPPAGRHETSPLSFDLVNDRYPVVHVLPGNDIWITASQSLAHIDTSLSIAHPPLRPVLVAVLDIRSNRTLTASDAARPEPEPLLLPYAQNSLAFRFFASSYAWQRPPQYEYRLNASDRWAPFEAGSLLRFPELPEGEYRLEVRVAGSEASAPPVATFPFQIEPPWHRTAPAYLLFTLATITVVAGMIQWSLHATRRRNLMLEQVVRQRTQELETTMRKLNEEARTSATLAERDRVAGEIHDSVQQGLTGAILQLETTLKQPAVSQDLHQRLRVVRNMVSYARQEVQHAVWNLESPLLEGNDLATALQKLTAFVASGDVTPVVRVTGTATAQSRQFTHHLLRIAQEATTNAVRHARPTQVEIHLEYLPDALRLTVTDDGCGFSPADVLNQAGHFGLRGLCARAQKLDAKLDLQSAPGAGTSIVVLMPQARVNRSE